MNEETHPNERTLFLKGCCIEMVITIVYVAFANFIVYRELIGIIFSSAHSYIRAVCYLDIAYTRISDLDRISPALLFFDADTVNI